MTEKDTAERERVFQDFFEQSNPMYFNVNEVPEEWRAETQALSTSHTIRGDGKLLIGIRRDDLKKAILKKRMEEDS